MDIRCDSKMHGIIVEPGLIEVKCDSKFCGHRAGVTVLHRFNSLTGELVETKRYKDPGKDQADAVDNGPTAIFSVG
jgi:hypothetical protein